jgi:hypothetical protein
VIDWIITNWKQIAEVIASIIGFASLIVKLTPTLKDDNILLPIIKFIAKFIALNVNTPETRPN